MEQILLNIGFGSTVAAERVVAIVSPNSAPMKRLKDEAKEEKRLVDATHGRRTRSIIVMDSNHIVLSAIQAETENFVWKCILSICVINFIPEHTVSKFVR